MNEDHAVIENDILNVYLLTQKDLLSEEAHCKNDMYHIPFLFSYKKAYKVAQQRLHAANH